MAKNNKFRARSFQPVSEFSEEQPAVLDESSVNEEPLNAELDVEETEQTEDPVANEPVQAEEPASTEGHLSVQSQDDEAAIAERRRRRHLGYC